MQSSDGEQATVVCAVAEMHEAAFALIAAFEAEWIAPIAANALAARAAVGSVAGASDDAALAVKAGAIGALGEGWREIEHCERAKALTAIWLSVVVAGLSSQPFALQRVVDL